MKSLLVIGRSVCARFSAKRLALAFLMLLALSVPQIAMAEGVTLPTTGVDVAAYVTALITAIGTVVAVAVGGYFAFLVIRRGLRWGRTAG